MQLRLFKVFFKIKAIHSCGVLRRVLLAMVFTLKFFISNSLTWYVNDVSTAGDIWCSAVGNNTNTGKSPNSPYRSLSHLLRNKGTSGTNELAYGDVIRIDAGTYNDLGGTNPDWDHQMIVNIAGLNFIGAGSSKTIFDHQYVGASTDFFMCITANDVTLQDISISGYENNGTQAGQCQSHSGQSISVGNATGVVITNVIVKQNGQSGGNATIAINSNSTVTLNGGGSFCNLYGTSYTSGIEVYGTNINLTINNYIIGYNYKPLYDGGGLIIVGGSNTYVSINNSRICNNIAKNGGAIAMYNGNLSLTNCILDNNTAVTTNYDDIGSVYEPTSGGAFFMSAGTATFTGCTFSANNGGNNHPSVPGGGTNGTYLRGGAIAARYNGTTGAFSSNKNISLTVDNCKFINNQSNANGIDIYGAVASSSACNITVTRSQFNTALNYNVLAANTPSISINSSGTTVTRNGAGITFTSAASTYNANPTPPDFSGTCGSITLLPIEFLDMRAVCVEDERQLIWSTGSEHNNAYFTIETGNEQGEFEVLTTVNGAGNSNHELTYQLPVRDAAYYRLSQTDYDGSKVELKTVSASPCKEQGSEIVYLDNLHAFDLYLKEQFSGDVEFALINSVGQVIERGTQTNDNNSVQRIFLSSFCSDGMYFLQVTAGSVVLSEKFMIRKQ